MTSQNSSRNSVERIRDSNNGEITESTKSSGKGLIHHLRASSAKKTPKLTDNEAIAVYQSTPSSNKNYPVTTFLSNYNKKVSQQETP